MILISIFFHELIAAADVSPFNRLKSITVTGNRGVNNGGRNPGEIIYSCTIFHESFTLTPTSNQISPRRSINHFREISSQIWIIQMVYQVISSRLSRTVEKFGITTNINRNTIGYSVHVRYRLYETSIRHKEPF